MAAKTFVPALIHLSHRVCKYIAKHHDTLAANLMGITGAVAALDALNSACTVFCTIVTSPPEEP